jgi:protoporphyrinogen oxidase
MRINIIGAGITGLSAAYYLTQNGHEVRIFDRSPKVGGLAGFFKVGETYLEKYYHHSFTGHRDLIELMRQLKIENKLFFKRLTMGFFHRNRMYPFASAHDLLRFTPLRIHNRIRLGLTSLRMMGIKDWQSLEKKGALEWLRSHSGDEACNIVWKPLLKMKFGDQYKKVSAAWLWNRVVDRKGANLKGDAKDVLGYIKGGYKTLFDSLTSNIESRGGRIYPDTPVEQISIKNGKTSGVKTNNNFFDSDAVLSTLPIPQFLLITPSLSEEYVNSLNSIKYQGSTCLVLKLRNPLSDYYWINVSDSECPFVGIIEHTNLVSSQHYGGSHLVYLTKYSSPLDLIFSRPHEDIYNDFISHLHRIFPNFQETNVEQYWVFQDRFSQPVFVKNYSKIMPSTSTPIRNLHLLNTAQIYPHSRSVNSSIAMARMFVQNILNNNES